MRLSSMFPQAQGLAAAVASKPKPAAQPTGLAATVLNKPKLQPGEFEIVWPKMRTQGVKNYKAITTTDELIQYITRCESTGLGGFDYETSGDENHREPPKDDEGNQVEGKKLDSWTRSVNLDPVKANVCAMSLSAAPDEARAIYIDNPGNKQFEQGLSRAEARKLLFDTLEKYFFTNNKITKIAVNLNFESKMTAKYGKYILMPVADPFLMWIRCLQLVKPKAIKNKKKPFIGKGLKPMTKETFGVQMNEFTEILQRNGALFFDQVPNDTRDALIYCCEDADYAVQHYLYWNEIAKQIKNANNIYPTYSDWLHNIEMPFARVTGLMEYNGMYWDSDVADVKRQEALIQQEEAAKRIAELAKVNFNMDINVGAAGKTKDVRSFIFDTLNLPAAAWSDKTKAPTLDGNALMDMIFMLENKLISLDEEKYLTAELPDSWETRDPETDRHMSKEERMRVRIEKRQFHPYKDIAIELLNHMQKIQKYATLLSSHIEGREKYLNEDNRIHAQYEPWTETARLASSNPNGQNVPRPDNDALGVRNFFKAPKGKVLFLIDESGFELRLMAWRSKCEVMTKAFINKEDLHKKTAARMTGKPESEVTKHERSTAKPGNFGATYGGTEYALQQTFKKDGVRKSLPECAAIVKAVKDTYPGIPRFQREIALWCRETGYAETIYGYKRLLLDINSPSGFLRGQDERRAANTPIQGSAADIMKQAQNAVYEKIGLDTAYFNTGISFNIWDKFNAAVTELLKEPHFMCHGKTDMISQIHDEIINELDDDAELVEKYYSWVQRAMEIPPLPGFPVPLVAEGSIAYSWGEKKGIEDWLKERKGL